MKDHREDERWARARREFEDITERNPHLRPRVEPEWVRRARERRLPARIER